MASDQRWECTVADLLASEGGSVKTGPFGTVLKADEYVTSGVPLISVREIVRGGFHVDSKTPRVSEATVARLPEFVLERNDIVFARKGSVERCAIVGEREAGWFLGSDGIRLRPPSTVDAGFLAYSFQSRAAADWLLQQATGSTMASLNQGILLRFPLSLPPLSMQRDVSSVLAVLDDRIDNLRQSNATLEAIAQALFKSWFVDFDPVRAKAEGREPDGIDAATAALFPNEFEDCELGLIPKGWKITNVGAIAELIKGCSYKGVGLSESEGAYMFNLGCFNTKRVFSTENIKRYTERYRERQSVVPGDLIMANTDMTQHREILGRPLLVPAGYEPGFVSHHVFKVAVQRRSADQWKRFLFFAFQQPAFRVRAVGHATGTTVLALAKDSAERCPIIEPSEEIHAAFDAQVAPLLARIARNLEHAKTLHGLRDTLLPRLISGKLRLPEAAALAEDAVV